jgi:hypothetical protein
VLETLGEIFIRGRSARIVAFLFLLVYVLVWPVLRELL